MSVPDGIVSNHEYVSSSTITMESQSMHVIDPEENS